MVHEGVPGHYLQLQHSRRFGGATERAGHDRMLAHGSPTVRLLRTVL